MRRFVVLQAFVFALVFAATLAPAHAQKNRRQLGAHQHGASTLAIAIEGSRIEMLLESPADDIVGFEEAPASEAQTKALAAATKLLATPARLFTPTAAAGCKPRPARIEHTLPKADAPTGKTGKRSGAAAGHAEFHASYSFECTKVGRLTDLAVALFKAFPRTKKLYVTVIGPKGQTAFELTPSKPELSLSGIV